MAPPQQRAVAPGTNVVRVDNIKDKSWVAADGDEGLLGQIFFATNDATLDSEDEAKLDEMAKLYAHDMILNPKKKYYFFSFGYADHRPTPRTTSSCPRTAPRLSRSGCASLARTMWGSCRGWAPT